MKREKIPQAINRGVSKENELILGSLIGVSVIAVIELLGLPGLSEALTVALYCFAISIPSLALGVLTTRAESPHEFWVYIWYLSLIEYVGIAATMVGFIAVFYHFSAPAAFVFCFLFIVYVIAFERYRSMLREVN